MAVGELAVVSQSLPFAAEMLLGRCFQKIADLVVDGTKSLCVSRVKQTFELH